MASHQQFTGGCSQCKETKCVVTDKGEHGVYVIN